jgi:hypothetical protein
MRQLEVLQPRAIIFKSGQEHAFGDHIFIPGTAEMSEEFEKGLEVVPGWKKQIDRLKRSNVIRVLEEGDDSGAKIDSSASPFGLPAEAAKQVIGAQWDVKTLVRWAASSKAKGAIKRAIDEQLVLAKLDAEERKQ